MFRVITTTTLALIGFLLPWHGAITVFGPEVARWWKEVLLLALTIALGFSLFKYGKAFLKSFKAHLASPYLWMILFLLWGLFLVFINEDLHTAVVAYRYLGFGFFAMLLSVMCWKMGLVCGKNGHLYGIKVFHIFATSLVLGVLTSTVFGVWAKLLGGFAVLQAWYSNTISSWVPGQTIPLYHQAGDFVRLQGGSSGPVEYAHLAVIAVWYILFFKVKSVATSYALVPVLILVFGIYHSGSRAALLGVLILALLWSWKVLRSRYNIKSIDWSADKLAAGLLVLIVLTGMLKFTFSKAVLGEIEVMNKNIVRISDSDHFTRPIEALNMALNELKALVLTFAPLMLLATIFDMTPVSLGFYIVLGLGLALPLVKPVGKAQHTEVFNLKRSAFKPYVAKVWGWQDREQQKFVAQELELGGVELIYFEGEPISTFSLESHTKGLNVYSFYVHPLYQSQGLGSVILNRVIPAHNLHLKVLKVNSRAKAFYEIHRFEVVGEDEHHWHLQRLI